MERFDLDQIVEKWAPVLDYADMPEIKDASRRQVTAVILENQMNAIQETTRRDPSLTLTNLLEAAPTNVMGASSSTASTGNVDIYDPVLISLVRRSFPNLMAYDLCGVQPMAGPVGLIFAMRSRYSAQDGTEALFNEADTAFSAIAAGNSAHASAAGSQTGTDPTGLITTGNTAYTRVKGMSTALGEALGKDSGNRIPEMAFSIEKSSVVAVERALAASYSHELAQDLKAIHGLDAEAELTKMLSTQVLADINREVIRSIYITATVGAQTNTTTSGYFDLDVDANGRWMEEKFKGLIFQINREANAIAKATRAGKGNWVVTTSDVADALNMVGVLKAADPSQYTVDDTGQTFIGTMHGGIKVYIDPYTSSSSGDQILAVGYKGTSPFDAGLFYCPYVPIQLYKTMNPTSFQPVMGMKTRYGLVAHPFATTAADGDVVASKKNKYFRIFAARNLM